MNSIKVLVNSIDNLYPGNESQLLDLLEDLVIEDEEDPSQLAPATIHHDTREASTAIVDTDRTESQLLASVKEDSVDSGKDSTSSDDESEGASASQGIVASITSLMMKGFQLVIFFPNYLIIKPALVMMYILFFPVNSMFISLGLRKSHVKEDKTAPADYQLDISAADYQLDTTMVKDPQKDSPKKDVDEYDTGNILNSLDSKSDLSIDRDDKTEMIKQENILANSIKSPSSSSKYIIPPPQRLYPLSRNPLKKRKKKTLILDLDETLIHSLSRASPRSFSTASGAPKMIEIRINGIASLYYVHKRPYCDYFLQEISKWYELQIFTASVREYADPIIDWLEQDIVAYYEKKSSSPLDPLQQQKIFTKRYYRQDCTYRRGVGYIKDLSKFFTKEDELKNVIILDNSPVSYALHEDNAVVIEGWINDQSDRDLLHLLPMLHSLSLCIDVRFILGLKSGEKVFEK